MLFQLDEDSPRFEVFNQLNQELLFFLEKSVSENSFCCQLFTEGAVGQACWNNSNENDARAAKDLTRDKFGKLHAELWRSEENIRQQLFDVAHDNQDMHEFFINPQRNLLDFLPDNAFTVLRSVTSHLYGSTKTLQPIVEGCGGIAINQHFSSFSEVNGNVCKACGMRLLTEIRANIPEDKQWRSDYDHQLCQSKYPLFSVHPDNLVPLCDVCNQDAKKAKDLFVCSAGLTRPSFYPFAESAAAYVDIVIDELRDPEPLVCVTWSTDNATILEKLETWNDVYEIKNLVEGRFRCLKDIIVDEIDPRDPEHLQERVSERARPHQPDVLKRKEWEFWYNKLFSKLTQIDLSAFWEKSNFSAQQGDDGSDYILRL